jgi:hypothetical protein
MAVGRVCLPTLKAVETDVEGGEGGEVFGRSITAPTPPWVVLGWRGGGDEVELVWRGWGLKIDYQGIKALVFA